jgi:hypothetical protein
LPTHQICFKLQSCGMLFGHSSKGICSSRLVVNKKTILGHPINAFFCIGGIFLLCKITKWWCHLLQVLGFTPIAHTYVHNIWFV